MTRRLATAVPLLLLNALTAASACAFREVNEDPCLAVTCSYHGVCAVQPDDSPQCACDPGFRLAGGGRYCEPEAGDADADGEALDDVPGDVPTDGGAEASDAPAEDAPADETGEDGAGDGSGTCLPEQPYGWGWHLPGTDCASCHWGMIGGTLYDSATSRIPVLGATVIMTDSTGREVTLVTQDNGNFWAYDSTLVPPIAARVTLCPYDVTMPVPADDPSCNTCHVSRSRIHLP